MMAALNSTPVNGATFLDFTASTLPDNVSSNLDWVAKSAVQVFDVGPPDHWIGWAGMDNVVRGILGKPVVKNEHIPLRVFLPSNLKGVDTSNEDALYGAKFRDNYMKLWGIK